MKIRFEMSLFKGSSETIVNNDGLSKNNQNAAINSIIEAMNNADKTFKLEE